MNRLIRMMLVLLAALVGLVACVPRLPAGFDMKQGEAELRNLATAVATLMADHQPARAYEEFLSQEAKDATSETDFKGFSEKVASRLGRLHRLDGPKQLIMQRNFRAPTLQGVFLGHFEQGDADVMISAILRDDAWKILRFKLDSPLMLDHPQDYRKRIEILVTDSDAVLPGAHVKVVSLDGEPRILAEDAVVHAVRWRVNLAASKEGFVTVAVSADEAAAIERAQSLAIRAK